MTTDSQILTSEPTPEPIHQSINPSIQSAPAPCNPPSSIALLATEDQSATEDYPRALPAETLDIPQTGPTLDSGLWTPDLPRRKRMGKIAELPKDHRATINHLLDNGATYAVVSAEMAKLDISLNGENISNWFQGGYQDYLQQQDWLTQMSALRENASESLQTTDDIPFHQSVIQVAVTQIFKSLKQEKFNDDPANYTRMLNALSRLSREALVFKKYQDTAAQAKTGPTMDPERDLAGRERDVL